ncbi:hypothetical protein GCM10009780_76650 [Actinomadura alba]
MGIATRLTRLLTTPAGVVIEADHTCMTLRGVQAPGSRTVTSTLLGILRDESLPRGEFFARTGS